MIRLNDNDKANFMCSEDEFVKPTKEKDGKTLMVVNEATDKVAKYYIAYKGRWREL